jgi:hypothetical protein
LGFFRSCGFLEILFALLRLRCGVICLHALAAQCPYYSRFFDRDHCYNAAL